MAIRILDIGGMWSAGEYAPLAIAEQKTREQYFKTEEELKKMKKPM